MKELFVLTSPEPFAEEAKVLTLLLDAGLTRLHIRKPNVDEAYLNKLIEKIPAWHYDSISLHDHTELAVNYHLGGIHLNKRNKTIPAGFFGRISRSCHTLEELKEAKKFTYVFLSPVFSSLSKDGYESAFSLQTLEEASSSGLINQKVIALGGIDKSTIPLLTTTAFGGIALLGTFWHKGVYDGNLKKLLKRFREIQSLLIE